MLTKGEYVVGINFNPSNNLLVDRLKKLAADFIDEVETIPVDYPDQLRLKILAQNDMENAAMWAVKAATKKGY